MGNYGVWLGTVSIAASGLQIVFLKRIFQENGVNFIAFSTAFFFIDVFFVLNAKTKKWHTQLQICALNDYC